MFDDKSINAGNSEQNGISRVEYNDNNYKILINVGKYNPEELVIETIENTVVEEAGHLNQLSNPYIMNEVKQKCRDVIKTTNNFQPNSVIGADNKGSPLSHLLTAGSASTLNGGGEEENLSAYFEPFGSALVPCAPGNRDSIASCESDSLLIKEEKKEAADCDKEVNI